MRYSYVAVALLFSGVMAIPVAEPQDLPMDAYDAIPDSPDLAAPYNDESDQVTVTYVPTAAATSAALAISTAIANDVTTVIDAPAAATSDATATDATSKRDLAKRGSCLPYSAGNGPTVNTPVDTVDSWYANPDISGDALAVSAPAGYVQADGWLNLKASASSPTYKTYTTDGITTYDPTVCAAKCDAMPGCVSFNIFFERNPSEDADDINCPTPPSITRIKCSFFGSMLSTASATNAGQWQAQFHVVIGGSNLYNKPPTTINGFTGPTDLGSAAIMSPIADNTYMRVQTFSQTQPYDPSVCAAACTATTAYALRHGSTRYCKFFDAYILYKNGVNGVFTCTYYTQAYGPEYAKNKGQYNNAGDHFTIGYSVSYSAN